MAAAACFVRSMTGAGGSLLGVSAALRASSLMLPVRLRRRVARPLSGGVRWRGLRGLLIAAAPREARAPAARPTRPGL
jgi:hypothetical protein